MKRCAGKGCSTLFGPYRTWHRYCSAACQQRGKYLRLYPNVRDYPCTIEGCGRPAVAVGFCNAHYLRSRNGADMARPIKVTRRDGCAISGCAQKHYGGGYCRSHYGTWKRLEITSRLVEALGGTCVDCKAAVPVEAFDFHHRDPSAKRFSIGSKVVDLSFDKLLEEAKKCDLLCANCHRGRHSFYGRMRDNARGASA